MDVLREAPPEGPTPYKLVVTRLDGGRASMEFHYKGERQDTLPPPERAGWNDATPWAAGTYLADRAYSWRGAEAGYDKVGRFNFPMWMLNDNSAGGMTGRTFIELHVGQANTANPVSYGTFGCLVADGKFLDNVDRFIAEHGRHRLEIEVRDDASVSTKPGLRLNLPDVVDVGRKSVGNIELTGDETGLSKAVWVRLPDLSENGGRLKLTSFTAPHWFAAKRNSSDGKLFRSGWYVKVPAGERSAKVLVEGKSVLPSIRHAELRIGIDDYAIFSPTSSGRARYYSDALSPQKLLIQNGATEAARTITVQCTDWHCFLNPTLSSLPAASALLLLIAVIAVRRARRP